MFSQSSVQSGDGLVGDVICPYPTVAPFCPAEGTLRVRPKAELGQHHSEGQRTRNTERLTNTDGRKPEYVALGLLGKMGNR